MYSDKTTTGLRVRRVTGSVSVRLALCIAAWTALQLSLKHTALVSDQLWQSVFVFQVDRPYYVWTWVTSIFSHLDPGHALGNIFALVSLSYPLEHRLSTNQYLFLFFGSAFAGILSFFTLAAGMDYYVVGVSGAVAGILGYVALDLATDRDRRSLLRYTDPVLLGSLLFAEYSAYYIISGGLVANGIANSAHLGGWAFGTLAALYVNGKKA